MLSTFQDIFGGSSTQSTPINFNPLTNPVGQSLTPTLQGYATSGAPSYSGPLTVGTTPTQDALLGQLPGQVSPTNNVNSYINSVLNGNYMPGSPNGNPFLSAAVSAATIPIQEQYATATGQTLPGEFAAAGQQVQGSDLKFNGTNPVGSSAFANAEALALRDATNAESSAAANVANNAYNTGVGQMIAASQLQPVEVQTAIQALQAELLPTLLQEQGITNGLTAFQENVASLVGFIQSMSGAIAPSIGTSTTGNSTTGIVPALGQLAGGFTGGGKSGTPAKA